MGTMMKGPTGDVRWVDDAEMAHAQTTGYEPVAADVAGDALTKEDRGVGGLGGAVLAGATSLASGVTLGASDAAIRALAGPGTVKDIAAAREEHPYVSGAANVAGLLADPFGAVGAVSKVGKAVAGLGEGAGLAGRVLASTAGGAAEGSIYGAGNAVSQLAMSNDPIDAEHISSALSSNMLLGGAIGGGFGGAFRLAEGGLSRASAALKDAQSIKGAIGSVPEDLASLDGAALKEAAATERTSIKAQVEEERAGLEAERVPQRAEVAKQVREMHQELQSERPIFHAVNGADVEAIEGVKDIKVQLAKSFSSMRSSLDNPIGLARDPFPLIRPLEMRQAALESLQEKAGEIRSVLGGDVRATALDHVDEALAQTRQQIDTIKGLSKSNPVTSSRLTDLQSGTSPRLSAIENAQEALKNAPEKGLIQKGAEGAAFAGGTALAHAIPGVGIAAPYVGKYASELVGKVFSRLAGAREQIAARSSAAIDAFLNTSAKVAPYVPMVATKVLGAAKFGHGPEPAGDDLHALYKARSAEIRQQTMYAPDGSVQMRPEARAQVAAKLAPIAHVNPLLADKLETIAARKVAYISQALPRKPDAGGIQFGPDTWRPSDLQMRSWARTVRAVEDPGSVEERLAHGIVTPEESAAYRAVYPERFAAMQQAITAAVPMLSKTLPMKRKVALSIFTGVPLIPALQTNVLQVLQGNFRTEPGTNGGTQAPKPMPAFGALGSMRSMDKPTAGQTRSG